MASLNHHRWKRFIQVLACSIGFIFLAFGSSLRARPAIFFVMPDANWRVFEDGNLAIHILGSKRAERMSRPEAQSDPMLALCFGKEAKRQERNDEGICTGDGTGTKGMFSWMLFGDTKHLKDASQLFLLQASIVPLPGSNSGATPEEERWTWGNSWRSQIQSAMKKDLKSDGSRPVITFAANRENILATTKITDNGILLLSAPGWRVEKRSGGIAFNHHERQDKTVFVRFMRGVHARSASQYASGPMHIDGRKVLPEPRASTQQMTRHRCTGAGPDCTVQTISRSIQAGSVFVHVVSVDENNWIAEQIAILFSRSLVFRHSKQPSSVQRGKAEGRSLGAAATEKSSKRTWSSFGKSGNRRIRKTPQPTTGSFLEDGIFLDAEKLQAFSFCPNGKFVWRNSQGENKEKAKDFSRSEDEDTLLRKGRWQLVMHQGANMVYLQFENGQQLFVPVPQGLPSALSPALIGGGNFIMPPGDDCP